MEGRKEVLLLLWRLHVCGSKKRKRKCCSKSEHNGMCYNVVSVCVMIVFDEVINININIRNYLL